MEPGELRWLEGAMERDQAAGALRMLQVLHPADVKKLARELSGRAAPPKAQRRYLGPARDDKATVLRKLARLGYAVGSGPIGG